MHLLTSIMKIHCISIFSKGITAYILPSRCLKVLQRVAFLQMSFLYQMRKVFRIIVSENVDCITVALPTLPVFVRNISNRNTRQKVINYLNFKNTSTTFAIFISYCTQVHGKFTGWHIKKWSYVYSNYWIERSEQTMHTPIRLFLNEQYDQGSHCLLFHLHL